MRYDAAWVLSFGKLTKSGLSNHAAASRVASCNHFLHEDYPQIYGFGGMVACKTESGTKSLNDMKAPE